MNKFESKTKVLFNSIENNYVIKFGFDRDTEKAVGISRGRLTLTGSILPQLHVSMKLTLNSGAAELR